MDGLVSVCVCVCFVEETDYSFLVACLMCRIRNALLGGVLRTGVCFKIHFLHAAFYTIIYRCQSNYDTAV